MSDAEMFLMAWAVLATIVAGLYATKTRNTAETVRALMFAITEIAEGRAEVTIRGDSVQVKKIKE